MSLLHGRASGCFARLALAVAGGAFALPTQAGHGLGPVGYSVEGLSMAGTDVAVARDSAAVNVNPAGLVQIDAQRFDLYFNAYDAGSLRHEDALGNRDDQDFRYGTVIGGSYARRLESQPRLVLAGGVFASGGSGYVHENLKTPFGNRDDINSIIGVTKFVVGAGWEASDRLGLGASVGYFVGPARQKLFPETSDAQAPFFGLRQDSGLIQSFNYSLGLRYEILPTLVLGAVHASKTRLPIEDATLSLNYESLGLGTVKYRDARIDGFAFAATSAVGLAWKPHPDLLLAVQYEQFHHRSALNSVRTRARDPDGAVPPGAETLAFVQTLDWGDQFVRSIGVAWQYSESLVLRAGYDYINNPIPKQHMSPLLNVIQGGEVTGGFEYALDNGWGLGFGMQWQVPRTMQYDNPALPFGASKARFESVLMHGSILRRW